MQPYKWISQHKWKLMRHAAHSLVALLQTRTNQIFDERWSRAMAEPFALQQTDELRCFKVAGGLSKLQCVSEWLLLTADLLEWQFIFHCCQSTCTATTTLHSQPKVPVVSRPRNTVQGVVMGVWGAAWFDLKHWSDRQLFPVGLVMPPSCWCGDPKLTENKKWFWTTGSADPRSLASC